ncbi:30S ribosomal protein S6 [Candidatus Woesebacteria bacterium RIFCSPLOWO2_01_FULL_39_23]|uniref:Small ribosomal subunit protein bS6 n=1 Tax=Candidatus Woesebacteria bacterium RIFCSPHIGHO2_01_FULL_40_22 TaxID=1802499 RepID=A0A1F7YIY6_9BACT|nr:MAG: 30S ribosomal protein S6 [Candidatus Woesebacteria bacterium RBG_16_40_11]OGM27314.1 MAG: 30S ribosomal protein S6 [Candidatus Woesebacteria bacterium RIFCSPHIGHO2_01_FULL_40_22]OGM62486.1 MAG: 30S ribosomal protein S6 [Candidatus Woesebacteria bacterium RIFCSPLOWO2_01_FULL_39_23]
MHDYELTLVLPGKSTAAKIGSVKEKLSKLLSTLKGRIDKEKDWGKINLAYVIKGSDAGVFLHFNIKLDGNAVKILNQKLKMEDDIIRYLLIRV